MTQQPINSIPIENASLTRRFLAISIDFIIFDILIYILELTLKPRMRQMAGDPWPTLGVGILFLILIYFLAMEASPLRASIGKFMLGLRVTDQNGMKISLGRSLLRVVTSLFLSLISLGLNMLSLLFSKQRVTFHDALSKTRVIHKNMIPHNFTKKNG